MTACKRYNTPTLEMNGTGLLQFWAAETQFSVVWEAYDGRDESARGTRLWELRLRMPQENTGNQCCNMFPTCCNPELQPGDKFSWQQFQSLCPIWFAQNSLCWGLPGWLQTTRKASLVRTSNQDAVKLMIDLHMHVGKIYIDLLIYYLILSLSLSLSLVSLSAISCHKIWVLLAKYIGELLVMLLS